MKRDHKIPDLKINDKKEIDKEKLKEIRKKLRGAKKSNDRGEMLFGSKNPYRFRRFGGFASIIITIILTLIFIINYLQSPPSNPPFLALIGLMLTLIFGSELGLLLLFTEIQTPNIFENGIEFPGAPIKWFNKPRFYWFADLKEVKFETYRYQVIQYPFLDFIKRNRFSPPMGPRSKKMKIITAFITLIFKVGSKELSDDKIKNEYIGLIPFFKFYPFIKYPLRDYLLKLGSFKPLIKAGAEKKLFKKAKRRLKYISPLSLGIFFIFWTILLLLFLYIQFPNITYMAEWLNADSFFILYFIIIFTVILFSTIAILETLRYFTIKRILSLQINGMAIPSEIKQKVAKYKDKRPALDLSKDKGMKRFLLNYRSAKKGYMVPKIIYFGSIIIIVILLLSHFNRDSQDTIEYKNPYTTNLYNLPTSNQFFIIEDTIFEDEILFLEDNITISRGASVKMRNMTINVFQNRKSFPNYGITIFISKSSTLILENCILNPGGYIRINEILCQGTLIVNNCKFDNVDLPIVVQNGRLNITNSIFEHGDTYLSLKNSNCHLENSQFLYSDDPIKIMDSNVRIVKCNITNSVPYYYEYAYSKHTGVSINKEEYLVRAQGKRITIEESIITNYYYGIIIDNRNVELPNIFNLDNNLIENCNIGLETVQPINSFENNIFSNCSKSIVTKIQMDSNMILSDNHFQNGDIILEQYCGIQINCYNSPDKYQDVKFEIINVMGDITKLSKRLYYKSDADKVYDYAEVETDVLSTIFYQNGSSFRPYPYSIYAFSQDDGVGFGTLESSSRIINITFTNDFDIRIDYSRFHFEFEKPFFRLGIKCMGKFLPQINVRVNLDNTSVDTLTILNCQPSELHYLDFYLENIDLQSIHEGLTFEATSISNDGSKDIFPENNKEKYEILFIDGDVTLSRSLSGYRIVFIKNGSTSINNQEIQLEANEEGLFWLISENGTLEIMNSSISYCEDPKTRSTYGFNVNGYGDIIVNNSIITNISKINLHKSNIIISNTSIIDSSLTMTGCKILIKDSNITGSFNWGYSLVLAQSNGLINNCTFRLSIIYTYDIEDYQYMENALIINNSIFQGSYITSNYFNSYIRNTSMFQTILEISKTNFYGSNLIMNSSNFYIGLDQTDSVSISDSIIQNKSMFYMANGDNYNFNNLTFKNCEYPIYLLNATINFKNITFINNSNDFYLIGARTIEWSSNITNLTMITEYFITLNFTDTSEEPLMIPEDVEYQIINVTNSSSISAYSRNISLRYEDQIQNRKISIWIYKKFENGTIEYFDPYNVNIKFYNKYGELIKQESFKLDPKNIKTDTEMIITIDFNL